MIPSDAHARLAALLGDRFSDRISDRAAHAQSESHISGPAPDAVIWPETTDEVAEAVKICAAARLPVVGWGREPRWKGMRWRCGAA